MGGFTSDQGATRLAATPHQSGQNLPKHLRIQFPGADVIEKEKRFCPQSGDVIHAMVDEIFPDGAVPAQLVRNLQLGAHPVDARHQHGPPIAADLSIEATTEPADSPDHSWTAGRADQGPDARLHPVAEGDIDPGPRISVLRHPR